MGPYRCCGHSKGCCQLIDKIRENGALHAGSSLASDLLLICQNNHNRMLIGSLVQAGFPCGVRADTVVVAVASKQGAIEAHILGLESRNHGQLGTHEICLGDTVFIIQQVQHMVLNGFFIVLSRCRVRNVAKPDVQLLALDGVAQRLLILLGCQMGKQIADIKHRISLVFTHFYLHCSAVL